MVHALLAAVAAATSAAVPSTMRKVTAGLGCKAPFASCVKIKSVATPKPKSGQALIQISGSSVNPSDVDTVEGGGCFSGCGADIAGTVVACPGCKRLKVGDKVWTLGHPAYAEYASVSEGSVGLMPSNLNFTEAGTIPEVGSTSYLSLKRTGASPPGTPFPAAGSPWTKKNITVVVTAGSGGTGFIGIELAKAWGAAHIATATTGAAGTALVKALGADIVTDYKKQDIFDVLPDDSVDVVYDNYGAEGTAEKAMHAIRSGGVYLLMPHGECFSKKTQGPPCLAKTPKKGVAQYNYAVGSDGAHGLQGLDEMKALFEQGKLSASLAPKSFSLADAAGAFAYSAGGGEGGVNDHVGKIAITMP